MEDRAAAKRSRSTASTPLPPPPSRVKHRIFKFWLRLQPDDGGAGLRAFVDALGQLLNSTKGCKLDERWLIAAITIGGAGGGGNGGGAGQHLLGHGLDTDLDCTRQLPQFLTCSLVARREGKLARAVKVSVEAVAMKLLSRTSSSSGVLCVIDGDVGDDGNESGDHRLHDVSGSTPTLSATAKIIANRVQYSTAEWVMQETALLHAQMMEVWSENVPLSERTSFRQVLIECTSTSTARLTGVSSDPC